MGRPPTNLLGERFGQLTVIEYAGSVSGRATWKCLCDCGQYTIVRGNNLLNSTSSGTKSCGHLKWRSAYHHQHVGSTTHISWAQMKQRCLNPKNKRYIYYGGRGITVCTRWMDFNKFLTDMGERPKGMTLERIDNNKGYSPDNCKWANYFEQNQNRTMFGSSKKED